MPRLRKTPRKERKRVVKVQYVPRDKKAKSKRDDADPYAHLDKMLRHHPELFEAKIAVAWLLDVKPDRDGHLVLGRCRKATDLDREFRAFDFVILLNARAWKELEPKQRSALVDHELCHAAVATDKGGEPIRDERDRKCYRMRRYDIEEFTAVVQRHGLYLGDVAQFVRTALEAPLFKEHSNGEAAPGEGNGAAQ